MAELFGRSYELTVSMLGIQGFKIDSSIQPALDIQFEVVRTLTREPNTAKITVINLSPINRANLEILEDALVELKAGYGNNSGVIFVGDCEVNNRHEKPQWYSDFEADDGGKSVRLDRVNLSFAPGATLSTVIAQVASSMRVGIGNTAIEALKGTLVDGGKEFLNGCVVSGQAVKQLNRLTRSSGLEWSIQNDQLQLLEKDKPLPQIAVVLNENTGLVGAPAQGNKGEVSMRSLLNKDLVPGIQIRLESANLTGNYRAEKCTYIGNTRGQEWYVDVEAKPI